VLAAKLFRLPAAELYSVPIGTVSHGAHSMRILGVVLLAMFLPLLASADDKAPPAGWAEVSGGYKKLAYVVWMPAGVKVDDKETSIVSKFGQIRVFRSVCERKDGMLFAAGQINLPPMLVKESPKVRQDFFRDSFLDEFNGKLVEEKSVKLGTMAGKEYLATTPKGMARYRLYGTGVQMFRILVTGTKAQVESKDTDTFFDSFKRTPEKLEAAAKEKDKDKDKEKDKEKEKTKDK